MARPFHCALSAAAAALFVIATARGQTTRPGGTADADGAALSALSWLAGCWVGPAGDAEWEVCYTTAEGGVMLSANKEIRGGKVVMFELEHFAVADGKVVLTPYPNGRKGAATFPLVEHDPRQRRAVFRNEAHDFPREIIYHRTAEDRLAITVSGEQNGAPLTLKLDLKRR